MFKNLRTSRKLMLLCAMFVASIVATTYSLIAEKRIAIAFARKELVGTTYLTTMRGIFATVLAASPDPSRPAAQGASEDDPARMLDAAQARAGTTIQAGELANALKASLRRWSDNRDSAAGAGASFDVLVEAKQLVARIADESNLALDPDLDSYHLQDVITRKLPSFLQQLSELQILTLAAEAALQPSTEQSVRFRVMEGVLRSIAGEVNAGLAAAYRGNPDGSLKRATDQAFSAMASSMTTHLGVLASFIEGKVGGNRGSAAERTYRDAVEGATHAWAVAQRQLDRLLETRIDGLMRNLAVTLALIGALVGLSIAIAFMTHRHIVRPLERLEDVASTVRRTKNYSLRANYASGDEIGTLATAFDDMLSELAVARERERAEQSELMRVARISTMGVMTASIAHEINQPLAAIVANSSAARRWLARAQPDIDEARTALERIANDGYRASQVIGSVRALFKKEGGEKVRLAVNGVIDDVLALVRGEAARHGVRVETELARDLPDVVADRVQLLQVFMNLIRNALDALASVADRQRLLVIKSGVCEPGMVAITVADSGTGIDPGQRERIFDAFYTTKGDGMGLGLSICRSIITAHGGRLWATPGEPHGSVFHVTLPSSQP